VKIELRVRTACYGASGWFTSFLNEQKSYALYSIDWKESTKTAIELRLEPELSKLWRNTFLKRMLKRYG